VGPENPEDVMKKILFLIISGGGGHTASAKAIAGALTQAHEDEVTTSIVDLSKEHWSRSVNRLDEIYRWMARDGVWMWKALWRTGDNTRLTEVGARLLYPFFYHSTKRIYVAQEPDLVVSVHSLVNHIPLRVLRKTVGTHIPFVTVVTDMVTVHPSWCCPQVDCCMVPTEAARQHAIRLGMPPERVQVVGQPVHPDFAANLGDKRDVRRRLGMDTDRPCVLIVGGGDGVGPIYEIARTLAIRVPNAQLVVVTGHNPVLRQRLDAVAWEIPTRIYGFVGNMPELMSASDLLVTKAGPGTLAEAFIAGLPVIISSYIPGQEEGNVRYVLEHGAGAYAADPLEIARIAREWLQPGNKSLEQVFANAAALARPDAALVIAQRLYSMLELGPAPNPGSSDYRMVEATLPH
jgi:1,2-diacylglycerol 3-beta-galactosyltransferase